MQPGAPSDKPCQRQIEHLNVVWDVNRFEEQVTPKENQRLNDQENKRQISGAENRSRYFPKTNMGVYHKESAFPSQPLYGK